MKGTGLFGGTFNPVHAGHIQVATEVKTGFDLERIYFILSAVPPHKEVGGMADIKDRYAMLSRALSSHSDFEVSDVEVNRSGRSYTIDTVTHYKRIFPHNMPCYLIMGVDVFLEIHTWKSFHRLFDLIPMIVMTRPGPSFETKKHLIRVLEDYLTGQVVKGYGFSAPESRFVHETKQPVILFEVTPMDISSTQIRALIKKGAPIHHLVPPSVETYIQAKGLYQ